MGFINQQTQLVGTTLQLRCHCATYYNEIATLCSGVGRKHTSTINTCHLRNTEHIWNNRIVAFSIKQLLVGTQHLTAPNQSMSIRTHDDISQQNWHMMLYIYNYTHIIFPEHLLKQTQGKKQRVVGRWPPLVPSRPPAAPLRRRLTPADRSERTMRM